MKNANRTSHAVEIMENGMHIKSFTYESLAICKKYKKMEETLKKIAKFDVWSENEETAVLAKEALDFDPLPN